MSKFSKILFLIWCILALVCFVSSFWAPLYFKIIGLAFGGINVLIILSLVITYFQGLYWTNKLEKDGKLQLQEDEAEATA